MKRIFYVLLISTAFTVPAHAEDLGSDSLLGTVTTIADTLQQLQSAGTGADQSSSDNTPVADDTGASSDSGDNSNSAPVASSPTAQQETGGNGSNQVGVVPLKSKEEVRREHWRQERAEHELRREGRERAMHQEHEKHANAQPQHMQPQRPMMANNVQRPPMQRPNFFQRMGNAMNQSVHNSAQNMRAGGNRPMLAHAVQPTAARARPIVMAKRP